MNIRYLLTVVWVVVIPLLGIAAASPQVFMPAKLISGHASLEKNCEACHLPWKGAPEQRCADCHAKQEPIINPETHGVDCKTCHMEHRGRNVSVARFDHAKVSYEMSANHARLECRECHAVSFANFSAKICADCHAKDKEFNLSEHAEFFDSACLNCHRKVSVDLKTFDHSKFGYSISAKYSMLACKDCHKAGLKTFSHDVLDYAIDEAHAKLECRDCHARKYAFSSRACADCHAKPEVAKGFDTRRHESMFGAQCLDCHGKAGFDARRFDHSRTGYFIEEDHYRLVCKDCHPQKFTRYTCDGACHGEAEMLREHRKEGIRDLSNCIECHGYGNAEERFRSEKEED